MQNAASMSGLDAYHLERRELTVQNGRLHAEIWRLQKLPATEPAILPLRKEISDNTARIRTLDHLIQAKRLELLLGTQGQ